MKLRKLLDKILVMNKAEQNGVFVLLMIIILVMVFRFLVPVLFSSKESYHEIIQEKKELIDKAELKADSLRSLNHDSIENVHLAHNKRSFEKASTTNKSPEYFNFDPNTVSLADLLRLGLSEKAANVFVNYRNSGAKFYKPADMMRVYSIDSVLYQKLEPYIVIEKTTEKISKEYEPKTSTTLSVGTYKKTKEKIEINSADSALWTSIPGIGPVFASRICKYRNLLGGFSTIEQLLEVYNFTDERYQSVLQYITIDTTLVKTININFADVNQFKGHPYINYSLARKLVDYRSKHGSFRAVSQLMADSLLTSEEFIKLKPYLSTQ
jgi:DNA uptake protein ComE-like DNA-binding protein